MHFKLVIVFLFLLPQKQNKELQQKIDSEVEQNRKLHEDLVDAYSQVHALKQEVK